MPEPINLLDCLVFVIPCPDCGFETRIVFSKALEGLPLKCPECDAGLGFKAVGNVIPRLKNDFQHVQDVVIQKGGWIEVSPPHL